MKSGTQVALAVGAGYLLGRRKLRLAMALGAAAATGGFGGVAGQVLKRGTKLLGSADMLGKLSPELTEVTDVIRGDLMDVGKLAAQTAARNSIDRFSDRLHEQAESLRNGEQRGEDEDGRGGEVEGDRRRGKDGDRRSGGTKTRDRRARDEEELEGYEDADEPEDDGQAEDTGEPGDLGEPEDEEEPEPDDDRRPRPQRRPAASGSRRTRSPAGSAPVRRARR